MQNPMHPIVARMAMNSDSAVSMLTAPSSVARSVLAGEDKRYDLPETTRSLTSLGEEPLNDSSARSGQSLVLSSRLVTASHYRDQRRLRYTGAKRTMVIVDNEYVDLSTLAGPMRTHIVRPSRPGRYPGIVFFSEIFQVTAPIRRVAAQLASRGYVVAVPEIYHEFEQPGTVLAYDQAGSDRGNALKTTKELEAYDDDARTVLAHLATRQDCTGRLGAMGICIGGHLAFRAGMNPNVLATACFYATDIHKGSLGKGMHDDSLQRAGDIRGELFMAWGRQDPHIPTEGRMKVLQRLNEAGTTLNWHEVNGAHAFLRDEGPRHDAELAHALLGLVFDFFHRTLAVGA